MPPAQVGSPRARIPRRAPIESLLSSLLSSRNRRARRAGHGVWMREWIYGREGATPGAKSSSSGPDGPNTNPARVSDRSGDGSVSHSGHLFRHPGRTGSSIAPNPSHKGQSIKSLLPQPAGSGRASRRCVVTPAAPTRWGGALQFDSQSVGHNYCGRVIHR